MALHTFPSLPTLLKAALEAGQATYWPTATIGTRVPAEGIAAPHIQHAWDGTTETARNFESDVARITVWGPKVNGLQVTSTNNLASTVQAYLVENGIPGAWRVTYGSGRLADVDDKTGLPFCTFTLNVETRPSVVA